MGDVEIRGPAEAAQMLTDIGAVSATRKLMAAEWANAWSKRELEPMHGTNAQPT